VIRAEDKRFFHHSGVDWLALSDAAWSSLFSSKARGASTLSMQVAAMLEARLRRGKEHRTLGQKWDQINAAQALEKAWTKRQILEAYLNLSAFRGELQGVGAASRALFGKQPSGLNERESLLLAVLLRGPNATGESVAKRACALGVAMRPPQPCEGLDVLAHEAVEGASNPRPAVALAPHVARMLVTAEQRRVQSTLDGRLQAFALDAVNRQLAMLEGQHVSDAAVLVVDNASGEILVYVGNSGELSSARYVDGVKAARQAGSTLKPFLYELVIEQRLLTAASLLEDSPLNIVTPGGLYVPQDYDREFKGLVSLRTALSGSLNVPAVRSLALVGPELFVDRLQALGFEHVAHDGDYYGYSLALGSAEVSLWELTNAYRALANGGQLAPLTLTAVKAPGQSVMDRAASYIVADILSDRAARSITFGLASPLAGRFWAAVKTGTSKGARQLVHRLLASLHRRRVGRQLRREFDVGCVGRERCGAALARDHEWSASRGDRGSHAATGSRDRASELRSSGGSATRRTVHRRYRSRAGDGESSRADPSHHRLSRAGPDHCGGPGHPARPPARTLRSDRGRPRLAVAPQRRAARGR